MRVHLFGTGLLVTSAILSAQSPADRIRGLVADDSARGISGATIFVTRSPDRRLKQVLTDSAGLYIVEFESGTGDYLVSVVADGFKSARRRVQASAGSHDLTANFVLARETATLAAVRIEAARPVRASNSIGPIATETGASELWSDGVNGRVSPSVAGDLSVLAATLPGLTLGGGGLSFMGSAPESNLATLNGASLPVAAAPRAARVDTRLTSTTFDPSRGGFAGVNIDVRFGPGSRFYQQRNAYFTLDHPRLQRTDALGKAVGAIEGAARVSMGADGELVRQTLTYNIAFDVNRVVSAMATLTTADSDVLAGAGVSADSIARVFVAAGSHGIPLYPAGVASGRVRDAITWLGRLDHIRDSLHTRSLTSIVSLSREDGMGLDVLAAASTGAERRERAAGAQLALVDFVGPGHRVLTQSNLSISTSRRRDTPHLTIPTATVLVRTTTVGVSDFAALSLGGSSGLASTADRWAIEGSNETVWNARGRTHRFKAFVWARADGSRQEFPGAQPGRFIYASLADFALNRPSYYARTLRQPARQGTAWNAALAGSHQWNRSRWFSLLYGVRAEAGGLGSTPPRNPALSRALGVETGVAPTRVHLSPRLGFTWVYNRDRGNRSTIIMDQVGTYVRPSIGVVRGGVGVFRDVVKPEWAAIASARTGLASGVQNVACVGTAVPIPDWMAIVSNPGSAPSHCADGSADFSDRAPGVSLVAPDFDTPHSWRASLDWNSSFRWVMWRISGVLSYDLNQPGSYDRNFDGVTRFFLGGGDGRPVFVATSAIDGASGLLAASGSRRTSSYGRVDVRTSDLRGLGQQVTLSLTSDPRPRRNFARLSGSLSYTWQRSHRNARGFDGANVGDPRRLEWAPSASDARHVFLVQAGTSAPWAGAWTLFSRVQSGLPFTPIVDGDIDGDGHGADRAFIPARDGSDTLGAAVAALAAQTSSVARRCLSRWAGRVPARNGCRGPWTASLNIQWRPPLPSAVAKRTTAAVFFQNVLGGIDQLLHGSRMRGWGTVPVLDPVLFYPREFDAASRTYRYDVNPRFADTRPQHSLLREPFRVTLDVRVDFSTNFQLQQLRRALEPVRVNRKWVRRSADSIATLYLARTSSLYALLLSESDSLLLSSHQISVLRAMDSSYAAAVRAIYVPLGEYLSRFADGRATQAALDSASIAEKAYLRLFWRQPEMADSILSPIQRDVLPLLKSLLRVPKEERENSRWEIGFPVAIDEKAR